MDTAESRGGKGLGILILRHEDFESQPPYEISSRMGLLGKNVRGMQSAKAGSRYLDIGATVGDIMPAMCIPKDTRAIPGHNWAWPMIVDGSTPTPTVPSKAKTISSGGGAQQSGGTVYSGPSSTGTSVQYKDIPKIIPPANNKTTTLPAEDVRFMLPVKGTAMARDVRFGAVGYASPVDAENGAGDLWPKFYKGLYGIGLPATDEAQQVNLLMPCDPRIISVNHGNDWKMGSMLCDTNDDGTLATDRVARFQSFTRVIQRPLGELNNAVALQLSGSENGDCLGGLVIDHELDDCIGLMSAAAGGPFDVGYIGDPHAVGVDKDGNQIGPVHLSLQSLFIHKTLRDMDGPLFHEGYYQPARKFPFLSEVHFQWDSLLGAHRWCAEVPIYVPNKPTETPPPPPPTETPPGDPDEPSGGGGGGGKGGPPDVQQPGGQNNPPKPGGGGGEAPPGPAPNGKAPDTQSGPGSGDSTPPPTAGDGPSDNGGGAPPPAGAPPGGAPAPAGGAAGGGAPEPWSPPNGGYSGGNNGGRGGLVKKPGIDDDTKGGGKFPLIKKGKAKYRHGPKNPGKTVGVTFHEQPETEGVERGKFPGGKPHGFGDKFKGFPVESPRKPGDPPGVVRGGNSPAGGTYGPSGKTGRPAEFPSSGPTPTTSIPSGPVRTPGSGPVPAGGGGGVVYPPVFINEIGFVSFLGRPNSMSQAGADFRYNDNPNPDDVLRHDTTAPFTIHINTYGAQDGVVGANPANSAPYHWLYTTRPRMGRFWNGTGNGGAWITPPEIDLADMGSALNPQNITQSTTYFGAAPNVYFGVGLPDLSQGGMTTGYRYGADRSGNATFDRVDAAGLATPILELGADGVVNIFPTGSGAGDGGMLRIWSPDGLSNVAFQAPDSTAANLVLIMPSASPTANQVLSVDSIVGDAVTMEWVTPGGGGVTGSGTAGTIPLWAAPTQITDSALSQSGTTVTASNDFVVGGKLTVAGSIDPTDLTLDEQASVPGGSPAAGQGRLWGKTDKTLHYTDSDGTDTQIAPVTAALLSSVISASPSTLVSAVRGVVSESPSSFATAVGGYTTPVAADFTALNTATLTDVNADIGDAISVNAPSSGSTGTQRLKGGHKSMSYSSGTITLIVGLLMRGTRENYGASGIYFRESGTSKLVVFNQDTTGSNNWELNGADLSGPDGSTWVRAPAGVTALTIPHSSKFFLKATYDGTNMKFYFSVDMATWRLVGTVSKTEYFTTAPDQWGFFANANTATEDVDVSCFHFAVS